MAISPHLSDCRKLRTAMFPLAVFHLMCLKVSTLISTLPVSGEQGQRAKNVRGWEAGSSCFVADNEIKCSIVAPYFCMLYCNAYKCKDVMRLCNDTIMFTYHRNCHSKLAMLGHFMSLTFDFPLELPCPPCWMLDKKMNAFLIARQLDIGRLWVRWIMAPAFVTFSNFQRIPVLRAFTTMTLTGKVIQNISWHA